MASERALREGDLVKASEINYGEIPALQKELEEAAKAESQLPSMVSEEVGPNDVAEVVSNWTGIPVGRLLQGETEKLMSMESRIGSGWSVSCLPSAPCPMRCAVRAPAFPIPIGQRAHSCSSVPPVSARPSWPRPWRNFCSMTSGP